MKTIKNETTNPTCYFCGAPVNSSFCRGCDAKLKSEIMKAHPRANPKAYPSVIAFAKAFKRAPAAPITSKGKKASPVKATKAPRKVSRAAHEAKDEALALDAERAHEESLEAPITQPRARKARETAA